MNENTINKPASLRIDEFIEVITDAINGSGLPLWMIEPSLRDIYNQVAKGAKEQKEYERAEYEKALAETKEADDLIENDN